MNVVDSSAWLEYFADGPNATYLAKPIQATAQLVPLADSVILATARAFAATVWTQNADFDGLPKVRYRRRE